MSETRNIDKRNHLTKQERIPASYKEVEKVLAAVKSHKGTLKTVIYNSRLSRLKKPIFNRVYALSMKVLKNRYLLEKIIEETKLLSKEPYLRPNLGSILVCEIIFNRCLPAGSKPVDAVLKHKQDILESYSKLKNENVSKDFTLLPKYIRVNSLQTTVYEVLKNLEEWNFQQIHYDDSLAENEFYDMVKSLNKESFLIDFHFKDVLVFAGQQNFTFWPLYQNGHVLIHDKSSYIPVHVLKPKPGSVVIDACAAPGMKTSHIAARMENKGILYAFERDRERFEILSSMMKNVNVNICIAACKDFCSINPNDAKYSDVEYILIDPSCSGSGMVSRMDDVTDSQNSKNVARIEKLAGFQIMLLKHALLFPNVKRVVYSTCSINERENEFVVHEVLNHFKYKFKLGTVMPNWPVRGSNEFEFGNLCLRSYPDTNLTNGFFVAVFKRIQFSGQIAHKKKRNKKKRNKK